MQDENSTPPDTQAIRRCLINHRVALSNLGQTNLEDAFRTPETIYKKEEPLKRVSSQRRVANIIRDVALYKNPIASVTLLIAGSFLFSFARTMTSGNGSLSVVTLISYLLLARVAYHVTRSMLLLGNSTKLSGSESIEKFMKLIRFGVDHAAQIHDSYITVNDPSRSLIVSLCLWATASIGKYLSFSQICHLLFFGFFSIPFLLSSQSNSIQSIGAVVKDLCKTKLQSVGFTRRQRNLSCVVLGLCVWICSDWSNRVIGLLMILLWIRCTLKPHEIEAIREQAAPLTMSVQRSAKRFSVFASKALRT